MSNPIDIDITDWQQAVSTQSLVQVGHYFLFVEALVTQGRPRGRRTRRQGRPGP